MEARVSPLSPFNSENGSRLPLSITSPLLSIESLDQTVGQATTWLMDQCHEDGHWCGLLEGDSILESEYVLLQAFLGRENRPKTQAIARALLQHQQPDGSWGQYTDGPIDISSSVKAYFALKICGHSPDSVEMTKARQAILAAGGADRVNSFTRFYLALLGQIDYRFCPAVPPEAILQPDWSPLNIYRISAWSRTMFIPLSVVWALRPVRHLAAEVGIAELFVASPEKWPPLRAPGLPESSNWISWENFFRTADKSIKWLESLRIRPLRKVALRKAERWMTERFVHSDGLGAIFPPIVWSHIALKCLGYSDDSAEVRYCDEQLDALRYTDQLGSQRVQPCQSPVWDTAIALRGLTSAGVPATDPRVQKSIDWLLSKQVTQSGDWRKRAEVEPGGWYFEYHNEFYPDIDDTTMVLMALRDQVAYVDFTSPDSSIVFSSRASSLSEARQSASRMEEIQSAAQRGINWLLAMQNSDGGWGAFDRDNNAEYLCYVPFADHNAMIDPSTPDITARVLESLSFWGIGPEHTQVQKAVQFLRDTQDPDGSWYGRWGVNYIYGTWQTLVGLRSIGFEATDPMLVRGAAWLEQFQQPCGGWGESCKSYDDDSWRGRGTPTASQTAWALLGLMSVYGAERPSIQRGIQYLQDTQNSAGTWDETIPTGTGFPRVFYLRYHLYPHYFPMMALGDYHKLKRKASTPTAQHEGFPRIHR